MNSVEEAFAKTTKLLFGKELSPLDEYGPWLSSRISRGDKVKSALTGKEIFMPNYSAFSMLPRDRVAGLDSLNEIAAKRLELSDSSNFREICGKMKDIAYYVVEFVEGENMDVRESSIYLNLSRAYRIIDCFNSKNVAYDFFCDRSEHLFGSYNSFDTRFCIHCYDSRSLAGCFEVDMSKNCSNSMFLHNCDNVRDSLFCFNKKNLQYAVANQVVGREKFMEARSLLCSKIVSELEAEKKLAFDIYSLSERSS